MFEHLFLYIYYNQLGKHFTGSLLSFVLPQPRLFKANKLLAAAARRKSQGEGREVEHINIVPPSLP